jgi:hypothetical protein
LYRSEEEARAVLRFTTAMVISGEAIDTVRVALA